jgi:hypothetical protein
MKHLKFYETFKQTEEILQLNDIFDIYAQYGNLSDIYVPEIKNQKQKWLFDNILLIIDELKNNNINTYDYKNMGNLGIKDNGNLAMFDLGFGDYFEKFEKLPEELDLIADNNLHKKILTRLGFKKSKELGSGFFGHAFDVGDNKVMKITKDKSEAVNSNKIKDKKMNHIANIYDVKQITIRNSIYYIIILEKLKTTINFQKIYDDLSNFIDKYRNKHLDVSIVNNIYKKHKNAGLFLKDMIKIGYEETWKMWRNKIDYNGDIDYNDLSEISEWIKNSVTNKNDINEEPPNWIIDLVNKLTK